MFPAAVWLLSIKDLKDLIFFLLAFFYRHAGPNGPEERFFAVACFPLRRARACFSPSHRAHERSRGTGPRATGPGRVFAQIGRSRGTGPRATVGGAASYNLANLANLANPAPLLSSLANPAHSWLIKKHLQLTPTPCYYALNLNNIDRSKHNYV